METFDAIVTGRRSVRKFTDEAVTDAELDGVMEAVRWSPSWANTQCWEIVVVRDARVKQALQESLPAKGNPAYRAVADAPVVLALCGKREAAGYYKGEVSTVLGDWYMFDLGIAVQTLCLSAWSKGLGTVIVGLYDIPKAAEVLGVPEEYQLVALVPMGRPNQSPKAPKRKEVADFRHTDRFGNRG